MLPVHQRRDAVTTEPAFGPRSSWRPVSHLARTASGKELPPRGRLDLAPCVAGLAFVVGDMALSRGDAVQPARLPREIFPA
jgi:hypothetical protein